MLLNRHPLAIVLVTGLAVVCGCQGPDVALNVPGSANVDSDSTASGSPTTRPQNFRIADTLTPSRESLEPFEDGRHRPIGVLACDGQKPEEFVANEVVFRPTSQEELDSFLARYNGVILRDGSLDPPPDVEAVESVQPSGYYLIRVDLRMSETDDLDASLASVGARGGVELSSNKAARLAALLLRERESHQVMPNLVFSPDTIDEHPKQVGFENAETWRWMSEASTGYSVGVIHAWEYLKYHGIPATPTGDEIVFQDLQRVAIIDRGFALDETTGRPLNDNPDYFYFGNNGPLQYDFHLGTNRAGGNNKYDGLAREIIEELTADPKPWHGSKAFGVCCALENNRFGTAGTGAPVAVPVLLRAVDLFAMSDAVRYAAVWYGADVISISRSTECGLLCRAAAENVIQNAVYTANAFGAIVLASAGNDGIDISDKDIYPCNLDGVICVGSVFQGGAFGDIQMRNNYGDGVDIWAPTCVYSTVTPDTAATDDNDFGTDEIQQFCGTSASAPYVAGIVALMRALDPSLRTDDVQRILQETSNTADDPRVTFGYVDAYRAVRVLRDNQPPTVELLLPADGDTVSYSDVRFRAKASDPEPNARVEDLQVVFSSERGAFEPCVGRINYGSGEPIFECNTAFDFGFNEAHDVRVTVYDPHDGSAIQRVTIMTTNTPPVVSIVDPADGATVFDHQPVELAAYPQDNQEHPFPDDQVSWQSDVDGDLGVGWKVAPMLSQATHVITATATDETGATATDTITLRVISGLGVPTGRITRPDMNSNGPDNGSLALPGDIVTLAATATDPEDGDLADAAFEWFSDRDGFLGSGQIIDVVLSGPAKPCNPEYRVHNITVVITDSDGNSIKLKTRVSVGVTC